MCGISTGRSAFGSSFGGNPLRQHIGVGAATSVAQITVTWPATGTVDRIKDVSADRTYSLREGEAKLRMSAHR